MTTEGGKACRCFHYSFRQVSNEAFANASRLVIFNVTYVLYVKHRRIVEDSEDITYDGYLYQEGLEVGEKDNRGIKDSVKKLFVTVFNNFTTDKNSIENAKGSRIRDPYYASCV